MIRLFVAVRPTDSLMEVAGHVVRGFQQDFPVVEGDRVIGVLPQPELLGGLSAAGPEAEVGRFMRTDFATAAPDEGDMTGARTADAAAQDVTRATESLRMLHGNRRWLDEGRFADIRTPPRMSWP